MTERPVVKRTARAILLDGDRGEDTTPQLVLIKRTKPGEDPYWITPGGGVEPGDPTVIDALHREMDEELGAKVTDVVPAFVDTVPIDATRDRLPEDVVPDRGVKVQHFFACRLATMDLTKRHGPEVDEPCGEYEVVRVPFTREGVASVDVVPPSLRHYLDTNIEGVRALLAGDLG
ncbi:NUDIX domain-containing protein [Streptomyces zagrosensis]|uniref:8-oxo-dGTP pyrophosphatase MutT (NUDIX family) n=1 Tax=Streptomyces zagrosensis TaxID=1042984 RepID=A0A7W9Q5S8_9ACTN|nr:NUDIX hydrolase [Streptomyces zagrosensis]MBB5934159.1 8-oxo-dGTP pyrophosphatase MutT (NUDIX family) [Streptomyces zagrosensis]